MGTVADFVELPPERWPGVEATLRRAGLVAESGDDGGVRWLGCRRGQCELGLGFGELSPGVVGVCVWSSQARWYRRPLGMWRLRREVRAAVRAGEGAAP